MPFRHFRACPIWLTWLLVSDTIVGMEPMMQIPLPLWPDSEEFLNDAAKIVNDYNYRESMLVGLPTLGNGCARVCLDLGNGFVAKISYWNAQQTRDEVRLWTNSSPEIKQHLMPIIKADPAGMWVVMPKAESVGEVSNDIIRKMSKATGIWDNHSGNVGMYEGRPVFLDYAG
jgi:hypothetical protein